MSPSSPPRILFATIAAGGSHVSSAWAMSEALARHAPACETQVAEIMVDYGFGELDRRHKREWRRALRYPWTIVWGQALIDRFPFLTVRVQREMLRDFARRAAERLTEEAYDLVVVNHAWLTVALTLAQRAYGLATPVLTFETSTINANALWADPNAERFVVGSAVSKARLIRFGLDAERIDIVGYPVRRAFLEAPDASNARTELGLADRFTILVTLGGEGEGGTPDEVMATLRDLDPDLQVVMIAGRNEALRERLQRSFSSMPHLRVEGLTDRMATYVAASDLVIAKTGPATVYEILAIGRPIVAPSRFGGAENVLIDILEREGFGRYAPSSERLAEAVRSYRDGQDVGAAFADRVAALDFPGMSERLARYIHRYATTRTVDHDAVGRGLPFRR